MKVAVVDATGKVVDTATVYPHQPRNDWDGALHTLGLLAAKHHVSLVSIGNGTGSRETDKLAQDLIKQQPDLKLTKIVVSEAGASVYSASEFASRELPDMDVSLRGAVRSGNSGGPMVDGGGRVVTTIFAATTNGPRGGYGVPNAIVREALAGASGTVSTGPCGG